MSTLQIELQKETTQFVSQMAALGFSAEESEVIYNDLLTENPDPGLNYRSIMKEILAAAARQYCNL